MRNVKEPHILYMEWILKMGSAKSGPFYWELFHIYCGLLQNKFKIEVKMNDMHYTHYHSKGWAQKGFCNVFERSLVSQLHLFDQIN